METRLSKRYLSPKVIVMTMVEIQSLGIVLALRFMYQTWSF
jgi:hypothetical protein